MSGRYHSRFFEALSSESAIKLRVYETYLRPWASKVGRLAPGGVVWVVDGFAGRGRYESGDPGSPLIAMQEAKALAQSGRNFRLQCLFGETRETNRRVLRELAGLYPESSAMIIEDDFWRRTEDVLNLVGSSPALLFVDPFGLLGVDFGALASLVQRLEHVDLIVNFRSPAAARLKPRLRDRVTRAVGSADWSLETIGQVFRENLRRAGGFLAPASLSVRTRLGGSVRSELILAARHPDAYELWNDQVIRETERLMGISDPVEQRRSRDSEAQEVSERILRWAAAQPDWWQRADLIAWYVVVFCGQAHTGTIGRVLNTLVSAHRIERQPARGRIEQARFRIRTSLL